MTPFDAIVLAGGRASRLGGVDKTALGPPGDTLLDRALLATAGAGRRVVVAGPEARRRIPGVLWTTETPRYGGPAAALAAGLALLGTPAAVVAVVAADLPAVAAALPRLLERVDPAEAVDGWLAVDPDGRDQPLLAAYRAVPLAAALGEHGGPGAPLRRALAGLRLARLVLPAELVADVDTAEDAARSGLPLPG